MYISYLPFSFIASTIMRWKTHTFLWISHIVVTKLVPPSTDFLWIFHAKNTQFLSGFLVWKIHTLRARRAWQPHTAIAPTSPPPRQDKFRRLTSIEAMEDERTEFDNDYIVSLGDMKAMADKEDQKATTDIRDEISKALPPVRACLKSNSNRSTC